MKMHLKLQLEDSAVLVTWLGLYPDIPWLSFVIKNNLKFIKNDKIYSVHVSIAIIKLYKHAPFGSVANQSACCRWFTSGFL